MKAVNIFLLSCWLIFMHSCSLESKHDSTYLLNPQRESSRLVPLEHIIDSIWMIQLEEGPQSRLDAIYSMQLFNNLYYVLPWYTKESIYVFNQEGVFIRRINHAGKGEKTYREITSFVIDEKSGNMYMSDRYSRGVHLYNLNENRLDTLYRLGYQLPNIALLDNSIVTLAFDYDQEDNSGFLKIYNKDFKIVNSSIKSPNHYNLLQSRKPFAHYNQGTFLGASMSDTIYWIENGYVAPRFVIGENNRSVALWKDEDIDRYIVPTGAAFSKSMYSDEDYPFLIQDGLIHVSNDVLFISMLNSCTILVDLASNRSKYICPSSIRDYSLVTHQHFNSVLQDDGYIYAQSLDIVELCTRVNERAKAGDDEVILSMQQQCARLNLSKNIQNPVILKYKLRPDFFYKL